MPDHAGPVIEELLPELQDNPLLPELQDDPVSSGQIALRRIGDRDAQEVVVESSDESLDSSEALPPYLMDGSLFWMTFNLTLHEEEQDYLLHKVLSMIHTIFLMYIYRRYAILLEPTTMQH